MLFIPSSFILFITKDTDDDVAWRISGLSGEPPIGYSRGLRAIDYPGELTLIRVLPSATSRNHAYSLWEKQILL